MTPHRFLADTSVLRAGRVGGWYDLVVTVGFATPWTAAAVLALLREAHVRAGLPGEPLPAFDGPHLLFVTLFGAAVTMWSVARIVHPVPWLVGVDTLGRLVFSAAFVGVLAQGHSPVVVPFLVLEVAFLVWQATAVTRALRTGRAGRPAEPAVAPQPATSR